MMGLFFFTEKSSLSSKLAAKAKSVIPESPEKKTVLVPDTPIAKQVRHYCVITHYLYWKWTRNTVKYDFWTEQKIIANQNSLTNFIQVFFLTEGHFRLKRYVFCN